MRIVITVHRCKRIRARHVHEKQSRNVADLDLAIKKYERMHLSAILFMLGRSSYIRIRSVGRTPRLILATSQNSRSLHPLTHFMFRGKQFLYRLNMDNRKTNFLAYNTHYHTHGRHAFVRHGFSHQLSFLLFFFTIGAFLRNSPNARSPKNAVLSAQKKAG